MTPYEEDMILLMSLYNWSWEQVGQMQPGQVKSIAELARNMKPNDDEIGRS